MQEFEKNLDKVRQERLEDRKKQRMAQRRQEFIMARREEKRKEKEEQLRRREHIDMGIKNLLNNSLIQFTSVCFCIKRVFLYFIFVNRERSGRKTETGGG